MGYIVASLLNKFIQNHDFYCQDDVYALLYEYCPNYIEREKLILWTIGICSGLNNEFIIAAHLLIPQVEYPSNIDRDGLYLWWMALKIFFCPDELFTDTSSL